MITKAVIAAAGRGTRFLPVVKQYPKELVPILSKPNIQYLVEEAIGAGIKEICIVQRPGETNIEEYFTPDPNLTEYLTANNKLEYLSSLQNIWDRAKLYFKYQDSSLPYGNASPALSVTDFIGQDNFIYMFGDDLTVENNVGEYLTSLINLFDQKSADAVAAIQQVPWEEISRYGSIEFDKNDSQRILGVKEKVPREVAPSNYTQLGRFVASPKIIDILKKLPTGQGGELWWADGMNALAQTGLVYGLESPSNAWMTTGDPLRWLKANIRYALMDQELSENIKEYLHSILK
ncbi:MAG TPA: sugar phosphate nucleotidyltransferase [Candidatus Woesebacteria bacterium]|nr:sugar phosphate nucleotidyltransferase [Candidatus Woesebacteria bacterium]